MPVRAEQARAELAGPGGPGVLAQHAEQPPHLGQAGPRGVTDLKQPRSTGRRHPGGGQPGRLRLDGDHGNVVGHDVVQFPGDPGPLPAGHVLEQGVGDDLPGGAVRLRRQARPPRDPGQGGRRSQRGQEHDQHAFFRIYRTGPG